MSKWFMVQAVLGVIGGRPLQSNVVTKDKAAGPEPAPPAPSNLHDSFLADAAKLMNKPRRSASTALSPAIVVKLQLIRRKLFACQLKLNLVQMYKSEGAAALA